MLACFLSLAVQKICLENAGELPNKNSYNATPEIRIDLPFFLAMDNIPLRNLRLELSSFRHQPYILPMINL